MEIRPQPRQELFLSSPADVAIFGGQAFGGKTFALLLECLRHIERKNFSAVIFRRTYPEITNEGGLWDTSTKIYPYARGQPVVGDLEWRFPAQSTVRFAHLQHEQDVYQYDGAQIPLICYDQLESFTWKQFSYLFKANRTDIGIRPYVRATCNPEPDSFLRDLLSWWIDDDTGLAIPERTGIMRYFRMVKDEVDWSDKPDKDFQSLTFIPSNRYDNPIGMESNPEYDAKLQALTYVDYLRQAEGNWNARPTAGNVFKRDWFEFVDVPPADLIHVVRYWDRAGTAPHAGNKDPDWTSGTMMGRSKAGLFYVLDRSHTRENPGGVESFIRNISSQDGPNVEIGLEQDPGQAGKMEAQYVARQLAGYRVRCLPKTKDKLTWAKPLASQTQAGNVKIVRGDWNKSFIDELVNFPEARHDDDVDSTAGAFNMLAGASRWLPMRGTEKPANGKKELRFGGNGDISKKKNPDEDDFIPIGLLRS